MTSDPSEPKTAREQMARSPVYLNIYDMNWLNEYASNVGVGIFHSGVEVYGIEYAYGGHPLPFSGIFENSPKDANELGENFKFRESILLGRTDFSADEVKKIVSLMGEQYRGDQYHLISKNCNHFTSALAKTLTGSDIPLWVNRLASISGSIPLLERCIPTEWLTPIALQNTLDEKSKMAEKNVDDAKVAAQNGICPGATTSSGMLGGASAASWKWFQRRASSTTSSLVSTASDFSTRSVPNTARSMTSSAVSTVSNVTSTATTASSQSLSKLWNSIKSVASSVDTASSSSSSSTSLTSKAPQPQNPKDVPPKGSNSNDSKPTPAKP